LIFLFNKLFIISLIDIMSNMIGENPSSMYDGAHDWIQSNPWTAAGIGVAVGAAAVAGGMVAAGALGTGAVAGEVGAGIAEMAGIAGEGAGLGEMAGLGESVLGGLEEGAGFGLEGADVEEFLSGAMRELGEAGGDGAAWAQWNPIDFAGIV